MGTFISTIRSRRAAVSGYISIRGKKNHRSISQAKEARRSERRRALSSRAQPDSDAAPTLAAAPAISPLDPLIEALRAEKIRFIVIGMMGAVLQGVPAVTFDIDLWIDLPPRQYMRVINLTVKLKGEIVANTVVAFGDELTVNFVYAVTGLRSFAVEARRCEKIRWGEHIVLVLPLDRILASKRACARPKDLAHIPLLERTIESKNLLREDRRKRYWKS